VLWWECEQFYAGLKIKLVEALKVEPAELLKLPLKRARR
jgi:hypothetical protein